MTSYIEKTEDNYSRQIHPVLCNTAKDGSGTWYFALVNADGVTVTGHAISGITSGSKAVTTAGTPETLVAVSTPAKYVQIQAKPANTLRLVFGGSAVDETPASLKGIVLYPGESSPWIPCDDLLDIYVDVAFSGEGVTFNYLT